LPFLQLLQFDGRLIQLRLPPHRRRCITRRSFRNAPQCFYILSPRACELEHQSTLLGIVRLCSRAEAFLRLIFIHLSQSWHDKPLHRIVPILGSGVPPSGSNDWWFRWPGALKGPERSCALASEAVEGRFPPAILSHQRAPLTRRGILRRREGARISGARALLSGQR
jgi:hypothetical protein